MRAMFTVFTLQFPADLVKFTEEIVNGKLHFLCNVNQKKIPPKPITAKTLATEK